MNIPVPRWFGSGRRARDRSPRPQEFARAAAVQPPGQLDTDPGFSMQVTLRKREIEVSIAGELDVYTAFLFTMALKRLERLEAPAITVDLTDLEFIDSSGLAALREARERADLAGRAFGAKRPRPKVRRFLNLAGESRLLDVPLPYLKSVPSPDDQTGVVQA